MFFGRGKNRLQDLLTLKDIYPSYLEGKEGPYAISYKEYRSICEDFFKMVMDDIIDNAGTFKFPFKLGSLRIIKLDTRLGRKRRYSVDFELTNKYGKAIYHLNEHSGGFKYMFKWDKINASVKHCSLYRFIPTRTNKRKLAFNIKNKITDYFDY